MCLSSSVDSLEYPLSSTAVRWSDLFCSLSFDQGSSPSRIIPVSRVCLDGEGILPDLPTVGSYASYGMNGSVLGPINDSEGVVSPRFAFLPNASFALASAMSFLVMTPTTWKTKRASQHLCHA